MTILYYTIPSSHAVRARATAKSGGASGLHQYKVHIVSVNNFPTAAGLASSAAGFACLGMLCYTIPCIETSLLLQVVHFPFFILQWCIFSLLSGKSIWSSRHGAHGSRSVCIYACTFFCMFLLNQFSLHIITNLFNGCNAVHTIPCHTRVGSGSACRSLHGGFVRWTKGENDDGSDSIATQVSYGLCLWHQGAIMQYTMKYYCFSKLKHSS